MLKNILILSLCLSPISSYAETLVSGSFGTDGASLQSQPNKNSSQQAATIYHLLDVTPSNGLKKIEANDGEFECKEPNSGLHTKTASCGFSAQGKKNTTDNGMVFVVLGMEISKELYTALNTEEVIRMGATTKTVENITCTKTVLSTESYSCTVKDVEALAFEL